MHSDVATNGEDEQKHVDKSHEVVKIDVQHAIP
jgi:hypothetical protein